MTTASARISPYVAIAITFLDKAFQADVALVRLILAVLVQVVLHLLRLFEDFATLKALDALIDALGLRIWHLDVFVQGTETFNTVVTLCTLIFCHFFHHYFWLLYKRVNTAY